MTAFALFLAFGALAAGLAAISLLTPGGPLEPMWRLNPRGREGLLRIGGWGPLLLAAVSIACGAAGVGFFRGRRWGYRLGIALLVLNLAGDLVNSGFGIEPRAAAGIPVVALMLWYLSTARVRAFFPAPETAGPRDPGAGAA